MEAVSSTSYKKAKIMMFLIEPLFIFLLHKNHSTYEMLKASSSSSSALTWLMGFKNLEEDTAL
jgi:hypothetical protein